MFCLNQRSYLCLRTIVCAVVFSLVLLPLHQPAFGQTTSADGKDSAAGHEVQSTGAEDTAGRDVPILQPDNSKAAAQTQSVPVVTDHKKSKIESADNSTSETSQSEPDPEAEKQGMSTLTKVGIGVGVAAVVGIAIGLAGGSSDSGPSYPTAEELVGSWHAEGISQVDERTYTGTFNFYTVGSHTYDVYVSDGAHNRGRGNWSLTEGTYSLRVENDSGSVYKGDFAEGAYNTITMATTNGRWQVTLSR